MEVRPSIQRRASILYLTPDQYSELNRIVNCGLELRARLNWFATEPDCGNQTRSDEQRTTLFVIIGHALYGRRTKGEPSNVLPLLSFIKTSYPRNVNDLAASSIGNVPVRF
jgi:hypothetical protein